MAAEGFEEGEAFRDAGAIEKVVEGVFDLAAIRIDSATGVMTGAHDPRSDGKALGL